MDQEESLERAKADLEMLLAAYPEEVVVIVSDATRASSNGLFLPLQVKLVISPSAHVELEIIQGYPVDSNIQISSYRSSSEEKARMEQAVTAMRATANQCLQDGIEGGFACVSTALDTWNNVELTPWSNGSIVESTATKAADTLWNTSHPSPADEPDSFPLRQPSPSAAATSLTWITGEPLFDRKSTFVAHACRLHHESDVRPALEQLMASNHKLHKATHNMVGLCIMQDWIRFRTRSN